MSNYPDGFTQIDHDRHFAAPEIDEHEIQERKEARAADEWHKATSPNASAHSAFADWLLANSDDYVYGLFRCTVAADRADPLGVYLASIALRRLRRDWISYRVEWLSDKDVL